MRWNFSFNLEAKFVLLAAVLVSVTSATLTYYLYKIELRDVLFSAERRARLVSHSIAASFTNTLLYEELGLIAEAGLLDNEIADMMENKDAAILEIIVLDRNGKPLSSSDYRWFEDENGLEQLRVEKELAGVRVARLKRGRMHQLEIVSPLNIHQKSFGTLAIYFSLENEYDQFARWQLKLYTAAFIFLIGSIGVAFIVARILANPIKRLAGEMIRVQDTSYTPELVTTRSDEIGYLERGFLEMMLRLNQADAEKNQSQQILMRAEKMATIGTLTAGLAHEINNPLGGMKTCLQRIGRAPENVNQIVEYTDLMEKALGQVENLVQGLLNYSQARDPVFHMVQLNSIIESVVEFIKFQTQKNGVSITTKLDPDLPLIMGDGQQLEQVVLNLILNAIDAVEHAGEVHIISKNDDAVIRISIYDNGCGIPPEELESIFEPFFTTKPKGQGTGLGLAVCQNILLSHEAKISVTSKVDKGTTVLLEFERPDNSTMLGVDHLSAAVLVGGKSRRMESNKALKTLNGRTMVEWVLEAVRVHVKEPLLITNDKRDYKFLGLPIHEDIIPNLGPIGGIYTALKNIKSGHCLIVACDLPFISTKLIGQVIESAPAHDLTIVDAGNGYEPLCAVYSRTLIPIIEEQIEAKVYGLHNLIDRVDAHIIKIDVVGSQEAMASFQNINTPSEFSWAQKHLSKGKKPS